MRISFVIWKNGCFWILQVDGESQLGFKILPSVGSTFQVSVNPICSLSHKLSPNGSGLCTLQISTSDTFDDTTGIPFSTSCTLPPLSSVVNSASTPTTGESFVAKHHR